MAVRAKRPARAPGRCALAALVLGAFAMVFAAAAAADQAAVAPNPAAPAADTSSAAEVLLFETDHMAGMAAPALLEYAFTWNGSAAFADRVTLRVGAAPEHRVDPDYFSGNHHLDFPPVEQARGNPLLLYFLESDLREMSRQTGGHGDYLRRQIRRALALPDLRPEPLEVSAGGRRVPAQRIVITPFAGDANVAKHFPQLQSKAYEFVLSPAVPGQIVSLATRVTVDGGAVQQALLTWTRSAPPGAGAPDETKQESR